MAYGRFTGEGTAFGWCLNGRVSLGGLPRETALTLICQEEQLPITTDAQGAWSGQLVHGVPLCVAQGSRVLLYDDSRVSMPAAVALVAARQEPPPRREEPEPKAPPLPPTPIAEAAPPEEAAPVAYRPPSSGDPVDALPFLEWPRAAEQLRPYFESLPPYRLFDAPGWRFVRAREGSLLCCFGYRAWEDRVAEVLYGVRARGGMLPPKGLQGYTWQRALDGGAYWVLRQKV